MSVPRTAKALVRQRANSLCEYCHSPEWLSTAAFTIDHILPRSLGGDDGVENLALACRRCNERRYNFTTGFDPQTGVKVPLFHPRQQNWSEHFCWNVDGCRIVATTAVGRATLARLDLNDEEHEERAIQRARQFWVRAELHPPPTDPRQES